MSSKDHEFRDNDDHTAPQKKASFPIVGIGASAGGLEAFSQLLGNLDAHTGMAFVLIQHLDPNHESMLGEILGRATTMPVLVVTDGMTVEPNHVYVIPPNTRMTISSYTLKLAPRGTSEDSYNPIDQFFRSLAAEQLDNAIGCILSGSGSDGAQGLAAIAEEGGATFAQVKESAKFDSMPGAAIENGVDYILTPEGIAAELAKLAQRPRPEIVNLNKTWPDFLTILNLLASRRSMDFSQYKKPTVMRRISRRMVLLQLSKTEDYVAYLKTHESEIENLYEDILIKVTDFFRDPESFTALKTKVFQKFLQQEPLPGSLRIWVPGCSTGEEAYSIAICALEAMEEAGHATRIEIFATDLSESALSIARAGYYDQSRMQHVSAKRLERFFIKEGRGFRVSSAIREPCIFAKQNVTRDPPFSKLDLISCRNLLIYLSQPLQDRVLSAFHFALNRDAFLALGNAETVGPSSDLFAVADKSAKIYSKKHTVQHIRTPAFAIDALPEPSPTSAKLLGMRADNAGKNDFKSAAERAILTNYIPPGVVINDRMEVLQFRGDTSPYLLHPPGDLTSSLYKMCREGLSARVRIALKEAKAAAQCVKTTAWIRVANQESMPVTVDVIPFHVGTTNEPHFVVFFNPGSADSAQSGLLSADQLGKLECLERELADTKEYLNAIIEREQAANEELKSANEEILSSNEELQSANEEMATAKEEVQATNQELNTVNEELQVRFQELNRVNSDLSNLFEATHLPIIMISAKLCVRQFTHVSEKVLNLSDADIGKSLTVIGARLKIPALDTMTSEVIKTLNTLEIDVQDVGGRWFAMRIKPYRTGDNRIDGAVIALRDITNERIAEQQSIDARNVAQAANLAKSDFLTNMSHEIRTPLSAILGYSELLGNPDQPKSDALHCISNIQRNVEHLTNLVDEILDISKIEAGKLVVERIRFPIMTELGEIFSMLQDKAKAKSLALDLIFDGEMPKTILSCPLRLRQILHNVVGNALKFTDKGGVVIVVKLVANSQGIPPVLLRFMITDTGCGLDLKQQQRLFQPFSQGDNSLTRKFGGTGLGLVLARRLAQALGGDFVLSDSKPGKGSTFTFTIDPGPLVGVPMLQRQTKDDLIVRKETPRELFAANLKLEEIRILLVEDGPDNQILMTHILEASGAILSSALNGAEALQMALSNEYDVILMDMQMPIMDGYEATRQLRAKGYTKPIIALTANAMRGEREICLAAGCVEYISKPFKANQLVATVAKFVSQPS